VKQGDPFMPQPSLFDRPAPVCRFCGGDGTDPNHWLSCDGQQGKVEAMLAAEDQARADRLPSFAGAVEGEARRDVGHAVVEAALDAAAQADAWGLWYRLCQRHAEVTSDLLWSAAPTELYAALAAHPNFVGNLVRQSAALRHWTEDTGRVTYTRRAVGQSRRLTVWRSLVFRAQVAG
jgi:hypothetical protein